jgi:hypothetical protein
VQIILVDHRALKSSREAAIIRRSRDK